MSSSGASSEKKSRLQSQSLLTEEGQETVPLLAGTSGVDQSPLERLILQTTQEQAATAAAITTTPLFIEDPDTVIPSSNPNPTTQVASVSSVAEYRITVVTVIAASFCLLHIALIWGSFLSNAWFDTHLTITFGSGTPFAFTTDQIIQETTLASLLSMLLDADQEWAAMCLVLCCCICPCLCMMLCVSWTYGDYQSAIKQISQPVNQNHRSLPAEVLGFDPRVFAEQLLIRIGFLAFFLLVILDIGTSSIALENNQSDFVVTNRSRGGLVCYVVGVTCALLVVIVLRIASQKPFPYEGGESVSRNRSRTEDRLVRAPPDDVFQELHAPLITSATDDTPNSLEATADTDGNQNRDNLATCKRIFVFEVGILSVFLWLPAMFLPLFKIEFGGLVAKFMDETSFEVAFYQLPFIFTQRSLAAGTDHWIICALGVPMIFLVYVFPLMATAVAVKAWRSPDGSKAVWFYKLVLRYIQPGLCGIVFSLSLLFAIPVFEPLGEYLLDSQTAGFCEQFENITDTSCLIILGKQRLGHWFLLAQSISIEIFVILTIWWKK